MRLVSPIYVGVATFLVALLLLSSPNPSSAASSASVTSRDHNPSQTIKLRGGGTRQKQKQKQAQIDNSASEDFGNELHEDSEDSSLSDSIILRAEMDVEFILEYGFFDGTDIREPTKKEIDDLVTNTDAFYNYYINNTDYELDSFSIMSRKVSTDLRDITDVPIRLELTANLQYSLVGDIKNNGTNDLDEDDFLRDMDNVNYVQYIRGFVWNSPEGSLFFDTNLVFFSSPGNTRLPTTRTPTTPPTIAPTFEPTLSLAPTTSPAPSISAEPTMAPTVSAAPTTEMTYDFDIDAGYGFFSVIRAREPTREEIRTLTNNTQMFYEKVFTDVFADDLASFELSTGIVESMLNSTYPVQLTFPARLVLADTFDSSGNKYNYTVQELLPTFVEDAGLNSYISNYVWNTANTSLFWETQRVLVEVSNIA